MFPLKYTIHEHMNLLELDTRLPKDKVSLSGLVDCIAITTCSTFSTVTASQFNSTSFYFWKLILSNKLWTISGKTILSMLFGVDEVLQCD